VRNDHRPYPPRARVNSNLEDPEPVGWFDVVFNDWLMNPLFPADGAGVGALLDPTRQPAPLTATGQLHRASGRRPLRCCRRPLRPILTMGEGFKLAAQIFTRDVSKRLALCV